MVQDMTPEMITAQIDAVFNDIRVDGVKIGMVSRSESIRAIADGLRKWNPSVIVVDPVMISKSGYPLLQPEACDSLIQKLLPLATLLTPNLPEAEAICGFPIHTEQDMERAAEKILSLGAKAVLVKGGHLEGDRADDTCLTERRPCGFRVRVFVRNIPMGRAVPFPARWHPIWQRACCWKMR
jgi:hydroxymethylpyrimidine/phosphomethylpyrimidine kinase